MKKLLLAAVAASVMLASPAFAALATGSKVPAFTAAGAEGGKDVKVDLAATLKKGPVVLYFYPAAFTQGCTIEAHEFATHIAEFKALGATVIGVSGDDIEKIKQFSADPDSCANAFTMAAASPEQIAAFDVAAQPRPGQPAATGPATRSSRTSYVIAPDGTILFSFGGTPADHVTQSLDAVKKWRAAHPAKG